MHKWIRQQCEPLLVRSAAFVTVPLGLEAPAGSSPFQRQRDALSPSDAQSGKAFIRVPADHLIQ
ncbi:hypothetical protein D3C78_1974240 [compost metagenome]